MKTVFFFLALIACIFAQDAYICEVVLPNFGTAEPTISLESTPYTFDNFNAVSFDSFFAPSGDVEGRTCIKNNLNLPTGSYSFGYELRTGGVSALDRHLPFSLVVGGDAVFEGGAILPDGTNFPYIGQKEQMFIGGSFTGPQYLRDLIGGSGSNFDATMDSAQAYFRSLSTAFSNVANSGSISIQWTTATVTCSGNYNSFTVSPSDFSSIRSYTLVGCSDDSQIVFNIVGDGQVTFAGRNIDHKKERVLYNIPNGNPVRIEVGVFGSILAPNSVYNQPGMGVVEGLVIAGDMQQVHQINRVNCVRPAPPPHPPANYELCPEFEQECAGLDINVGSTAASFRDYHAISFGDYTAETGDVEGRLAVRRHFTVGAGYTIGFELSTQGNIPDRDIDYSLLVGGNVNWTSGSIHPDTEGMYVGGSFRGADYLESRVNQGSSLDTLFDGAKTCYEGYQNDLAAQSVNVDKRVEYSAMILSCRDSSASQYVVNIDGSEMASYTYYVLDNCNAGSQWIINVVGSGDVTFTGDSFPAALAVFNVIGSGRTIYVTGIALNGHLLAPNNNLKQTGGVIIGKVVVGNVDFALQINKFTCPDDGTPVEITTVVAEDAQVGDQEFETVSVTLIPGDRVAIGGAQYTVASSYGRSVNLQTPLKSDVSKGSKVKTSSAKTAGRTNTSPAQESSSSIVSVAFALFAIVALLI